MNHIGWPKFMPSPLFYLIFIGMNTWKFGHTEWLPILAKFLFHLLYNFRSENWPCWLMNLIVWRTNIQPKLWKLQKICVYLFCFRKFTVWHWIIDSKCSIFLFFGRRIRIWLALLGWHQCRCQGIHQKTDVRRRW